MHNEEQSKLYVSPSIIRIIEPWRMGWAGYVARKGENSTIYRLLVRKAEVKTPLGRSRHKCVDNIKMDRADTICGGVNLIGLDRDRDNWSTRVNGIMDLWVP
jgi:hypothetical protein